MKGFVRYFQRDNTTGLMIPGTYVEDTNTIQNGLKYYLSNSIEAGVNKTLTPLFAVGQVPDSGDLNDSGIALNHWETSTISNVLNTDLNAGGTGSESYFEYLGSYVGAVTLRGTLILGHDLQAGLTAFLDEFAYYTINVTVPAARTFYFYWRITLS